MRHEFRHAGISLVGLLIVILALGALFVTISVGMELQVSDAAAKYKQVLADYNKAKSEFEKADKAAKTDAERKAANAKQPNMEGFAQRMLEVANAYPKDAAAYNALAWIVRSAPDSKAANPAINTLARNHVSDDRIAGVCQSLGEIASPPAENLLRAILDKNPNENARGQACLGLAHLLKSRYEDAQSAKKKANANALFKEVVAIYQRVETEFGEVKGPGRLLGAAAKAESFEFRFLTVGKTVPEIVGEDVDGQKLKLSDYRGKVVVLPFWGTWCPFCRGLYPFERSLVARLKNKPFAIVGVNSDEDKPVLQKAMKKENITWRSFWDRSTSGPIHTTWNIQVWPTVYVIGPKGAIRGKFVGAFDEKDLEKLVDDLVKNAGK